MDTTSNVTMKTDIKSNVINAYVQVAHTTQLRAKSSRNAYAKYKQKDENKKGSTMVKRKIVVLGGSFNPPTKAHLQLMNTAMQNVQADMGIFVPSSNFYVTRKANRPGGCKYVISEENRMALLTMMCSDRMTVDTCEFGDTSTGRTLKTLRAIQKRHPGDEIYFIMGADKLTILPRWKTANEMLSEFHILWASRKDQDPSLQVLKDKTLAPYIQRMAFMQMPNETKNISSSLFWKRWKNNDTSAFDLLHPLVADWLKENL